MAIETKQLTASDIAAGYSCDECNGVLRLATRELFNTETGEVRLICPAPACEASARKLMEN